jgi:uncharacterized protein YciI
MTYFLCKMIPPRSDFVQTMTDSKKNIMKAHGDYLQSLAEVGSIVCHGPVDDPKGGWGLSIFSGKDQTEVERLTAADPIILDDDAGSKFTAQSMSPIGTNRTNRAGLLMSVNRGRPEVAGKGQTDAIDPTRT